MAALDHRRPGLGDYEDNGTAPIVAVLAVAAAAEVRGRGGRDTRLDAATAAASVLCVYASEINGARVSLFVYFSLCLSFVFTLPFFDVLCLGCLMLTFGATQG